jgi:predicted PurR-regulated permease PerM
MTITNASVSKKIMLLFLLFTGLYFAKVFLMPLSIAGILATLLLPFCNWMERIKIPRGLAAFICLLTLLLTLIGLIILFNLKISEALNDFDLIKQKIVNSATKIQEYIFTHVGISVKKQTQIFKDEQPSFSSIMQVIGGSVAYIFTNLILVLTYVLFLLYYRTHIKVFLLKISEPDQQAETLQLLRKATNISQQYLLGLSKMIVCLWIMYGIGFSIVGIENAIFFAILCGLLEIVPYVGNIIGTTLTVLVTALHSAKLSMLGGVVITYGIVQFIQGWVLEPMMLGPQVKINPLFTIIALVLGELLWGIAGVIIAIPLTAILKIVCDHIESLKPYGFLIGEIEILKKESNFKRKIKAKLFQQKL